jgi:glycine hydroxymethyltransferase
MVSSGIRIGLPAITTRGIRKEHMKQIAVFIDNALMNRDNIEKLKDIRKDVVEFTKKFPIYKLRSNSVLLSGARHVRRNVRS